MSGKGKYTFVGLDLETTAGNQYGRICQVGAAFNVRDRFVSDVNPGHLDDALYCDRYIWDKPPAEGRFVVEKDALKVNGFDEARMAAGAPREGVDDRLAAWLERAAPENTKPRSLIAVGFNVAGFDMPFVRRELPKTAAWFHYRTVDLNAICFALGAESQMYDAKQPGMEFFKKRAKKYATHMLGDAEWHDAGFDACAALVMFQHLHALTNP